MFCALVISVLEAAEHMRNVLKENGYPSFIINSNYILLQPTKSKIDPKSNSFDITHKTCFRNKD